MPISTKTLRTLLSSLCMALCATSAFASTLTGVVTNRTTGKPSAGDTVAVINTAQSMNELAKATTDGSGRFRITTPDGGQTLLHITHRSAEYFKSVPPGLSSIDVDVYDSSVKVDGIANTALVLRAETDSTGKTLNLIETFGVQNASIPPRTQVGGNTFDFYLPKGATIIQTQASTTGGLATNTDVKTLDASTGHYAFTFPVRPGETRFEVAYSLPYSGQQPFALRLSIPTSDVAIMLPKSMKFAPTTAFQPINLDANSQSFDAHQPNFAQPVEFTLSGTGQLPQMQSDAQAADEGSQPSSRPGGGLGTPTDPEGNNDPWTKYKWVILGMLGLLLAAGSGAMLRSTSATVTNPVTAPLATELLPVANEQEAGQGTGQADRQPVLLRALKDELFALETDRQAGHLSDAQYAEQKAAFDVVLRRALARSQTLDTLRGSDV